MKKITLMIAFVAFAFNAQAQNPFENLMLFDVDATVCAGDGEGNCDPANSNIELTSQVTITLGENSNEIIISDITGGLYEQGYGASDQEAIIVVDDANQTLTVTDAPDTVFGGDLINATGSYTTDANGDVDSFDITWSNSYGDGGSADYTFNSILNITAPGVATNPSPADEATDVTITLADTDFEETAVAFSWDAPTTGDAPDSYNVIISDVPTLDSNDGTISGSFTSNDLGAVYLPEQNYFEANSTYYWAVIPENAAGTPDSENVTVWSFTTGGLSNDDFETSKFTHFYSNGQLGLEANQNIDKVSIYNMLGQEMMNTELSNSNESINVSSLSNGMYITKVTIGDKTETFKFIKK